MSAVDVQPLNVTATTPSRSNRTGGKMKRAQMIKGTVCMLLGALLAAPVAFWLGAGVGVEEFQYADAKSRAAIVTFQLEKIQRQDIAALESGMQIELNMHLADYGRYLQSNWKW